MQIERRTRGHGSLSQFPAAVCNDTKFYVLFGNNQWTTIGIPPSSVLTLDHCTYNIHGTAPQYLTDKLQYVADLSSRRRGQLRSSTSSLLDVRPSRLVTVGDRSFATAGPRLWNSLPVDVQSAPSLTTFRHKLKTHLFRQSYPDIVL